MNVELAGNSQAPIPAGTVVLFGEVVVDVFPGRRVLGGAPFNVARHLRAFGLNPVLITRTGSDAARDTLLNAMERFGMDTRGVQCDLRHPTGQVAIHPSAAGHSFDILPEQAYDYIHPGVARLVALSSAPALFYFGSLAQRSEVSRRALGTLLRSIAAPKLLDVNLRPPWYDPGTLRRSLAAADIVKVNNEELGMLASLLRLAGTDDRQQASSLITRFSLQRLVVTCGDQGAWLLNADGTEAATGPSRRTDPIQDTVGAGDSFASVLILGVLSRWPMPLTLARANDFARAVCGIHGAVPPDDAFYKPFLKNWHTEERTLS